MVNLASAVRVSNAAVFSTSQNEFRKRAIAEGFRSTNTGTTSPKINKFIPITRVVTQEQNPSSKVQPKQRRFFSIFKKREAIKDIKQDINFGELGLL